MFEGAFVNVVGTTFALALLCAHFSASHAFHGGSDAAEWARALSSLGPLLCTLIVARLVSTSLLMLTDARGSEC